MPNEVQAERNDVQLTDEQKRDAIQTLYHLVIKIGGGGNVWKKDAEAYHEEVKKFAKTDNHTEEELQKFYNKFLYQKNGTAGIGQASSQCSKKPSPSEAHGIFNQLLELFKSNLNVVAVSDEEIERRIKNIKTEFYKAVGGKKPGSIINRVVSTVLPGKVSAVVNEKAFFEVYDWLAKNGFVEVRDGNVDEQVKWYVYNVRLMEKLMGWLLNEKKDEEKVDAYDVSHFIWRLYEIISGWDMRSGSPIVKYGPPGTGKTYTAQIEIRNMLNAWSILAAGGDEKSFLPEEEHVIKVQFHPSYGYEDFVEGLRPDSGEGRLVLVNGDFKELCKKAGRWECDLYSYVNRDRGEDDAAQQDEPSSVSDWLDMNVSDVRQILLANDQKDDWKKLFDQDYWKKIWTVADYDAKMTPQGTKKNWRKKNPGILLKDAIPPYCMLIDEINRAELSRVFGELMYSLEYRGPEGMIRTQYSRLDFIKDGKDTAMIRVTDGSSRFFVPHNVFIIGTMNTIDRSIESFDFALRRRFRWERVPVDLEIARGWLTKKVGFKQDKDGCIIKLIDSVQALNESIKKQWDEDHEIGHAYLMKYSRAKQWTISEAKAELWDSAIRPLLEEYSRGSGQSKKIEDLEKIYSGRGDKDWKDD